MSVSQHHSKRLALLTLASSTLGLALCACLGAPETSTGESVSADEQPLYQFDPERFPRGKVQPLVEGIKSIENQLFTKSGRLFVTGDEGIYEIVLGATGEYLAKPVHSGETCSFGGLTEFAETLYANCYDMSNSNSVVFASRLTDPLDFQVIQRLPGVALANGLTSDATGNLFVASTFDGKIIRLRLKQGDPLSIEAQDDWNPSSGLFTNGLQYFDSTLYWTAFTTVYAAPIRSDGTAGPTRELESEATFFDDMHVDGNGTWLADYLNGAIVATQLDGHVQASTPASAFNGPSSVQPTLGRLRLPSAAFLVSEKGADRLSLYMQ